MSSGAISLSEVIEKLDSNSTPKTALVDVRVFCLLAFLALAHTVHATEL